jgi:hypothetical protein
MFCFYPIFDRKLYSAYYLSMPDQFAVYDGQHGLVIEVFRDSKAAKEFAKDYRQVFRCCLPKVVGTQKKLKPGDHVHV